jgi:hypothetical protein
MGGRGTGIIMEKKIINIIKDRGPLRGSELIKHMHEDAISVLRACRLSKTLAVRIIGTRYMRLDRKIEGYARLSPSVLREFLTYSVVGLTSDKETLERKAAALQAYIEKISRSKFNLAFNIICALAGGFGEDIYLKEHACFILAGDIVFNMAHDEPRPERSTRKMVQGSDMDIVVVVDNRFPEELVEKLDQEIYKEKYRQLLNPYMREEIDYVIKNMDKVSEQLQFDNFKRMVACKIMHEGAFLFGSEEMFLSVKGMLRESGVIKKIMAMEEKARQFREKAEEYLIKEEPEKIRKEGLDYFFPAEESEEFE